MYVLLAILWSGIAHAWESQAVDSDPLVRMPGTQPSVLQNIASPSHEVQGGNVPSSACINCHKGDPIAPSDQGMPFFQWQGSMMAQAARDPIFWATMTVAAQDSIWAVGRPNAIDICLRCHFPEGWLGDRSDELNGSAMTGSDFDGIHCAVCHRMYDPFAKTTNAGTREGGVDQTTYWDEATSASQTAANATAAADALLAGNLTYMNGNPLFSNDEPTEAGYTENGGGQMFIDLDSNPWDNMRGPFVDSEPNSHGASNPFRYSRYHKSKFFCSTCHDVSNPVLANLGDDPTDGLLTEQQSAFSYAHVERTFSEFMSSGYGSGVGTTTNTEFQNLGGPATAAKCQDCHLPDVQNVSAASGGGVIRPSGSSEHPNSGTPAHDLQGGNMWITHILASLDESLDPEHDTTNLALLNQGPSSLTLNLNQGISPMFDSNGEALLAASERAKASLQRAAVVKNLTYDSATGVLAFRIQNNTGHKLLTGYPEGRRIFVNIKAYNNENLVYEINPYDYTTGTLKGGFSFWNYNGDPGGGGTVVPAPTTLGASETFIDDMVYEAVTMSSLTEEDHSFHFALATGRYKDNRIPPKGFNLSEAKTRLCEPVASGGVKDDPATPGTNLYTAVEYAGGYDDVTTTLPVGISGSVSSVKVTLYYQGTSREYVEFLRDEINGTGTNRALYGPGNDFSGTKPQTYAQSQGLNPDPDNAYLAQADPFFTGLKAWGSTIWELWAHNHGLDGTGASVDGIVPFEMASTVLTVPGKMNILYMTIPARIPGATN